MTALKAHSTTMTQATAETKIEATISNNSSNSPQLYQIFHVDHGCGADGSISERGCGCYYIFEHHCSYCAPHIPSCTYDLGMCLGLLLEQCSVDCSDTISLSNMSVFSTVPSDGRPRQSVRDFSRTDGRRQGRPSPSFLKTDGMSAVIHHHRAVTVYL